MRGPFGTWSSLGVFKKRCLQLLMLLVLVLLLIQPALEGLPQCGTVATPLARIESVNGSSASECFAHALNPSAALLRAAGGGGWEVCSGQLDMLQHKLTLVCALKSSPPHGWNSIRHQKSAF